MVYGLWLVSLCLFEWMELGAKMAGKDIIGKDHCGDMAGREFGEDMMRKRREETNTNTVDGRRPA